MVRDLADIVDCVPQLRGKRFTVAPLDGGLTNRNFHIECDGLGYVVRVAGENTGLLGIDRACEAACAREAARHGIGPEVVASIDNSPVLVTRFITGRVLTAADVRRPDVLPRLVKSLRAYHDGPPGAVRFSPFDVVRSCFALARDRGVVFPPRIDTALERLAAIEATLTADQPPCPCHNDLLASNFIDSDASVNIID